MTHSVVLLNDGTVKILDIKNMTTAEKTQVVAQYPELAGKEIVE